MRLLLREALVDARVSTDPFEFSPGGSVKCTTGGLLLWPTGGPVISSFFSMIFFSILKIVINSLFKTTF